MYILKDYILAYIAYEFCHNLGSPEEKNRKKIKNSVTTMISVDGEIIFPVKLKLKGNCFNKRI